MANTAGGQTLLTRYLIFETDAEGVNLTRIGEELAKGSEEALRKHFAAPLAENDGHYVAVSENHFKLRTAKATVKTTIGQAEWPPLPKGEELPFDPVGGKP
jgi:hypothetical protein